MAGLAAAAAIHRPFLLRRRPDLKTQPAAGDATTWFVEDPAAARFYELGEEEYFLFRQLDGGASLAEICERYAQAFAPRQLDARRLDQFTAQLYRQGLLVSDAAGQGTTLRERAREQARAARRRAVLNPLAIRLPGFDPEPLLGHLTPLCGALFTRTFAALALLLLAAAGFATALGWSALVRELDAALAHFTPGSLVLLAAITAGAKIVHELAHAVACRRLGGQCREIGVLLLVGTPCLYCDVTSIWMIPERWKRVVVGAAGMAAEILLAATAILLWSASRPGVFHDVCLQLAVVCSVATLVFNGNPLLRYDGYFILTDLTGMTNLGERSDAALRARLSAWLGGESLVDEAHLPRRNATLWACYAAASAAYRLVVTLAIWWFLRRQFAPAGLTPAADALAGLTLLGMVVLPAIRAGRVMRAGLQDGRVDGRRLTLRGGGALLLLAAIFAWPWPYDIAAPAVVQAEGARWVYVVTPGRIVEAQELGATVTPADTIARLENLELEREVAKLRGEAARARAHVALLERRRVDDATAGDELPAAREVLQATEERLALREGELQRLRIAPPQAGTLLPLSHALARRAAESPGARTHALNDSPLEPRLRGRFLEAGTPLCAVGDPRRLEALVAVDQREIEFVREGTGVRVQLDVAGLEFVDGRVVEAGATRMIDAPPELAAAGLLALEVAADGTARPAEGHYLVRVSLDALPTPLPLGAVGRAKIAAPAKSLAERAVRFMCDTFRAENVQ